MDHAVVSEEVFLPPARVSEGSHVPSMAVYNDMYQRSIADPKGFWSEMASSLLTWERPFDSVSSGGFKDGDITWFAGGKLNVSVNCIDRHLATKADQTAIIFEDDERGVRHISFAELHREVCRLTNLLKHYGVRKGDTVAIYLPMIPEIAFAMLACTRLGAVHSVVFAGFSAESLRDRIVDANSSWVITADQGLRGGRTVPLKATVDTAVGELACVRKVFVYQRTGAAVPVQERDVIMSAELPKFRPSAPAESMDAEDMLFLLYTSGSTGKPKGVAHTTGGYLLYAAATHKYVFDARPGDVYACVADCGWITGHSYILYGPLTNGTTTLLFESIPTYPDPSRYWDMVERHRITQFYTSPTALRALMRFGNEPVQKHNLTSLRVLGTVGEPINPEAWRWYHGVVGGGRCSVVDTFWQTETGGHMLTPLPGCTPEKPGSATLPFFGVVPALLDSDGNEVLGNDVAGVLCMKTPWPSIARTVYGDHERYLATYMKYKEGYYFTGDGAYRDKDGFYWVTGRVDDVINVSGHRLGSAEIESALVAFPGVSEAAVIGFPHDIKGQGICCYVTVKEGVVESPALATELKSQVRKVIGPFATPDFIILSPGLPKTRSGKIMRRILRKIISQETDSMGDLSTLADPSVVADLIERANAAIGASKK